MANFTKQQALALISDIQGVAAQKFQFADKQRAEIQTFYKERSYRKWYEEKVQKVSIGAESVTYIFDGGKNGDPIVKDFLGAGNIDTEKTGFIQKTVYMSTPIVRKAGFFEADLQDGMKDAVAVKYTKALNAFEAEEERLFLKKLVTAIPTPTSSVDTAIRIDIDDLTTVDKVKAAMNKVADGCFAMSELENDKYAIDGISENDIFLDLSSKIFNRLVDERIIVDAAFQTFGKGIFMVGNFRGFKVRRNEFLGKPNITGQYWDSGVKSAIVHGIIATGYTAVSPVEFVTAKAGELGDLSADKGYYIEKRVTSSDGKARDYCFVMVPPLLTIIIDK